jgi:hypothetical protein
VEYSRRGTLKETKSEKSIWKRREKHGIVVKRNKTSRGVQNKENETYRKRG